MNINRPLFTVVTASYNCAQVLDGAIRSVLTQSCQNFEYIIIDGGSTDGSVERIRSYEAHLAYWISEPDNGVYDAWNKALAVANGDWISFLGADDRFKPDALEVYDKYLSLRPSELEYVSSRVELCSDGFRTRTIGRPWTWPEFGRYMTTPHVGAQHHRSLFSSVGSFNSAYKICGDYELLLRKRMQLRAGFVDAVTVEMGEGGMSSRLARLALRESERAKHETGGRNALACRLERYYALLVSALRTAI